MNEGIPFPQIPRIDEEKKLEGPPQDAEDSLFLSVPGLSKTVDTLAYFNKANKNKSKEILLNLCHDFLRDPQKMTEILDSLHIVEELKSGAYRGGIFENRLLEKLKQSGEDSAMTQGSIEKWLELSIESGLYGDIADQVLKNTVEGCSDRTALVNLLYKMAIGGLKSGNDDIVDKTLETLSLQNKIFNSHSRQIMNFVVALSDVTDEDNLKKMLEIDAAVDYFTIKHIPDLFRKKQEAIGEITTSNEFIKELKKIVDKDPEKGHKLAEYYKKFGTSSLGIVEIDGDDTMGMGDFPYRLITQNPGPLREWLNERIRQELVRKNGEKYFNISVPGCEGVREIEGDLAENIAEIIKNCDKNSQDVTREKYWQTLSLMVPVEIRTDENINELRKINKKLKEEIINDPKSLLSPRGDEIEITDEFLKGYGINSILYEVNPKNKIEIITTLDISGLRYRVLLDEYLTFRNLEDHENMNLSEESVFVKNVVLSHLYEIMCSENITEIKKGEKKRESGSDTEKKVTPRRPFRRNLPENHNPTEEQIRIVFDRYKRDIIKMNKIRELQGKKGKVTYVCEVDEVNVSDRKPVKSHTPGATKKLKEILKNHNREKKE